MPARRPPPPPFDLPRLRTALPTWRIHYLPTVRSTNDLAAKMRRESRLFAPAIVFTANQTAGRGRGANKWSSDPGTLTATFALPMDDAHPPHHLPILAGLAVRDAAASLLPRDVDVALKWPNDLLIDGKKLAGLLCERIDNVDLVGVGLNVSTHLDKLPKEVKDKATTLDLAGASASLTTALITLAHRLHAATTHRAPFATTLKRYNAHHHLLSRRISIQLSPTETLEGTCEGLDPQGRLLLRTTEGLEKIICGQVTAF